MRELSVLLLVVAVSACSAGSTVEIENIGDVSNDGRSSADIHSADVSTDKGLDVSVDPIEHETIDPCSPPAVYGCVCDEGADCASGFCELHLGEKRCTDTCIEDCPDGFDCIQYGARGPDLSLVCLSLHPSLCVPCQTKGDCHGTDDCFQHTPEEGALCSPWCDVGLPCPTGYMCTAMTTASGAQGQGCTPDEGACPCSLWSIKSHQSTFCELSNEWGTCQGVRVCEEDGLTDCSAEKPAEEVCGDGLDNDCDGYTDPVVLCHDCMCGDGICDPECGEDIAGVDFCHADCCECGDGGCEEDLCGEGWKEGLKTCAMDCAICGDGVCDPSESPWNPDKCAPDCCGTCGDGTCKCSENPDLCPEDCGQWACGDGTCNPGENPVDCSDDCLLYACGNGTCEPGEEQDTCQDDCGSACGNCECEGGESYDDCPVDCGFCGDGYCISKCDYNKETSDNCLPDCPLDCVPDCDGEDCGSDGCGGICGVCTGQDACVNGQCVCQPQCSDMECGDDGCGGSCGDCGIGGICLENLCYGLEVAGTYQMTSTFAMASALPGQAGELANLVVDLFYNPGPFLIDMMTMQAEAYVGPWVTDVAFGLFEDALADIVADVLLNTSPDWVQDLFVVAQDLVQIVNTLTLTSELHLTVAGGVGPYSLQGVLEWQLLNLQWESGVYQFTPQQLADTAVPIAITSSQFTGVATFDQLLIDAYTIDLNLGKLVLLIMNEILVPAVAPYNDVEELVYSIIDCQAVADGVSESVLDANGLTHDDVESFCEGAVDLMVSPVENVLAGLSVDSDLQVQGVCDLVDDEGDLIVDRLENGLWSGQTQVSGQQGAEFDGIFQAERIE